MPWARKLVVDVRVVDDLAGSGEPAGREALAGSGRRSRPRGPRRNRSQIRVRAVTSSSPDGVGVVPEP
jgi:hypothetical protein